MTGDFEPRRVAGHSILYGLAGGLGKGVALLTVPVVTRLLGPADYGVADLANALAAMLAMLAMFAGDIPGSRLAGAAAPSDRRMVFSTYVWTTVAAGLLIGGALLPLSPLIASSLWAAPDSTLVAVLAVALVPVSAAQASVITVLRIDGRPGLFAVLATVDLLAQMILGVAFATIGWGPAGLIGGFLLGSTLGLAVAVAYTWPSLATSPNWSMSRTMLLEGAAFLPASLGFVLANYAVRFLLVDTEGQAAVGQFALAYRLASGMALVSGAFSMAWGPYALAMRETRHTARLFGVVLRAYGYVSALTAIAIGAFGPELSTLVSGSAYTVAGTMLPGLIAAAAMSGAFYVLLVAAGITGKGRAVAIAAIAGAVAQVLTAAAFLPSIGVQAVGTAAVVGQASSLVVLLLVVRSSVLHAGLAVTALCAGGFLAVLIGIWNGSPSETIIVRTAVGIAAAATAAVLTARFFSRAGAPTVRSA